MATEERKDQNETSTLNKEMMPKVPDYAKIASAIALDKGKPNQNEMSNFRPVSILNTFSKIYEKVIKDN